MGVAAAGDALAAPAAGPVGALTALCPQPRDGPVGGWTALGLFLFAAFTGPTPAILIGSPFLSRFCARSRNRAISEMTSPRWFSGRSASCRSCRCADTGAALALALALFAASRDCRVRVRSPSRALSRSPWMSVRDVSVCISSACIYLVSTDVRVKLFNNAHRFLFVETAKQKDSLRSLRRREPNACYEYGQE